MSALSTANIASALGNSGAGLSVTGLASGLDTHKIIQGLTAIDQQRITEIDQRASAITAKQNAFKQINVQLLALQANLTTLSRPQNGLFEARTATSSDTTALTAAAT